MQVSTPSSGSVTYKYDALGRRIQRAPSVGASTNFIYDGQDVVQDLNSDATTVDYLNGPGIDNKISQTSTSGRKATTLYYLADHLGSTTALTNKQGRLLEQISYDSYGDSTGSVNTRYDYTGRERDPVTGLIYYRARWYEPQLGRFISEDPSGLGDGINLLKRKPPKDPYELDQELLPTGGCVRLKNRDVNGLIQAINNLPKDDPLEFIFIGDHEYLNNLAIDSALANQRWQLVLRI